MKLGATFSITNNLGLDIQIPVVIDQRLKLSLSSGYTGNESVLEGKTGFGDINLGLKYVLYQTATMNIIGLGRIQLANGSSPDEVKDDEIASTGSGHRAYLIGTAADILLSPGTVFFVKGIV